MNRTDGSEEEEAIKRASEADVDQVIKSMLRNEYDFYEYVVQRLKRQLREREMRPLDRL